MTARQVLGIVSCAVGLGLTLACWYSTPAWGWGLLGIVLFVCGCTQFHTSRPYDSVPNMDDGSRSHGFWTWAYFIYRLFDADVFD